MIINLLFNFVKFVPSTYILFKRTSMFIFNILFNLSPTNLASIFLSKACIDKRHLDRIEFFDTSNSRVGKKCITNCIKNFTENWILIGLVYPKMSSGRSSEPSSRRCKEILILK